MDTTIKCNNCDREMGLVEFLAYPGAYLAKLFVPTIVEFIISAMKLKISMMTRGTIDESMSGLAASFKIACPNCGQINWYPASGPKPKNVKQSETLSENIIKI